MGRVIDGADRHIDRFLFADSGKGLLLDEVAVLVELLVGLGDDVLGIAICGGLVVSQILTLYTTPVVYVYLDRFGSWAKRLWRRFFKGNGTAAAVTAGK